MLFSSEKTKKVLNDIYSGRRADYIVDSLPSERAHDE